MYAVMPVHVSGTDPQLCRAFNTVFGPSVVATQGKLPGRVEIVQLSLRVQAVNILDTESF